MKNLKRSAVPFISAALLALAPLSTVFAEEAPTNAPTAERLENLELKLRNLEKLLDAAKGNGGTNEIAQKESKKPAAPNGYGTFIIKSADGNSQLKFGGYIQAVNRTFFDAPTAIDTFIVRRALTTIDATLLKNIDFRTQWDFGQGKVVSQDNYLNIRFTDALQLKAGKFKVPFGLENLASSQELLFLERALPTTLGPNRDIGFQLHGDLLAGALNYAIGAFGGVADGATGDGDTNNEKEFAGRIFAKPFKGSGIKPLQGLAFGIAGTYGDQGGATPSAPNLPSLKTPGQEKLFGYRSNGTPTAANTAVASGTHYRLSPQGYYYWGPFGLLGEYVLSSQDVSIGNKSANLQNDAWQLQLSYVLTGEDVTYRGVTPSRPFILGEESSGWGAVQLVTRYSTLNVSDQAFPTFANITTSPRTVRAYAGGVNWYLNRNLKFVLNYEHSTFDGGATNGDRPDEKVFASNIQVSF